MGCAAPGAAKVGHLGKPGNKADHPQSPVPFCCDKMRRLRPQLPTAAPRHRSSNYDLRRAPSIHPHFARNAIRVGTSQRFLSSLMHFASMWAKLPRVASL